MIFGEERLCGKMYFKGKILREKRCFCGNVIFGENNIREKNYFRGKKDVWGLRGNKF